MHDERPYRHDCASAHETFDRRTLSDDMLDLGVREHAECVRFQEALAADRCRLANRRSPDAGLLRATAPRLARVRM
jgi:hypothetical protein